MNNTAHSTKSNLPWLIGFYLDPDAKEPNIYTLFVTEDSPLAFEGYVVFFSESELAVRALELCGIDIENFDSLPKESDLDCDVARSLYLVSSEDIDSSATLINFLNVLLDLVKATQMLMPEEYKRLLYEFSDHLTFHRELSTFFTQRNVTRSTITDAILWCIGAVVSKSKLIVSTLKA
jgi:hypothetical protein